jgi:hypothetical protein
MLSKWIDSIGMMNALSIDNSLALLVAYIQRIIAWMQYVLRAIIDKASDALIEL